MNRIEAIKRFWQGEMPAPEATGMWISVEEVALIRSGLRDIQELLERIEYLEEALLDLQAARE